MRFRAAANLAPNELSSVLETVRKNERSGALVDYMLANADWTARLRAEYAKRFDEIESRFNRRVLELTAVGYPLERELELQRGLENDKAQEELELLRELTIAQIPSS
jgi:hypothetical protein